MPIIPIQQQRATQELGQLRYGYSVETPDGKRKPMKMNTWRITTRNERLAEAVAAKFEVAFKPDKLMGKTPTFDIRTGVNRLKVVIPPGEVAIDQWRELWAGGRCTRRCDGVTNVKTNSPCASSGGCAFEYPDEGTRIEMAKKGKACKDVTRARLLLPYLPDLGLWRVATTGYFAAMELGGKTELLAEASARGFYTPADLWLDEREKVIEINGKPTTAVFVVPCLYFGESIETVAALGQGGGRSLQEAVLGTGAPAVAAIEAGSGPLSPPPTPAAAPAEPAPEVHDDEEEIVDAEWDDEPAEDARPLFANADEQTESISEALSALTTERNEAGLIGPSWAKFAAQTLGRGVTAGENDFKPDEVRKLRAAIKERAA